MSTRFPHKDSIANSVLAVTIAAMLFTLLQVSACASQDHSASSGESARYSYKETQIDIATKISTVLSLERLNNGSILVVGLGTEDGEAGIWEISNDNSLTLKTEVNQALGLNPDEMVGAAAIASDGNVYFSVSSGQANGRPGFYVLSETGDATAFDLQELSNGAISLVSSIYPTSKKNNIVLQSSQDQMFLLNITEGTSEKINTGSADGSVTEHVTSYAVCEGKLFCLTEKSGADDHVFSLLVVDLLTNSVLEADSPLQRSVGSLLADSQSSFAVSFLFADYLNEQRLGLCTQSGVYRIQGETAEQIAGAEGTKISNPNIAALGCVFTSETDFILVCINRSDPLQGFFLYRYERQDTAAETLNELTVYSLEDTADVRFAASLFRDAHPGTKVTLEIGLNDSAITVPDAIQRLNIELISGKGPDIIFLDGLPAQRYCQQGALLDMTDVYQGLMATDLYYKPIISAFASQDGCFALPSRFSFPLAFGATEEVGSVNTFADLIEVAKLHSGSSSFFFTQLDEILFYADYPNIIKDSGLDAASLTNYYQNLQTLSTLLASERAKLATEGNQGNNLPTAAVTSMADDSDGFLITQLDTEYDYGTLEVIKNYYDGSVTAAPLSFSKNTPYLPRNIVGIRQTSDNLSLSKEFVQLLFSNDFQNTNQQGGLSVSKQVIVSKLANGSGIVLGMLNEGVEVGGGIVLSEENSTTYSVGEISAETATAYRNIFASLDSPVTVERIIRDIFIEQTQLLLSGKTSVDDAVAATQRKVNLYLTE